MITMNNNGTLLDDIFLSDAPEQPSLLEKEPVSIPSKNAPPILIDHELLLHDKFIVHHPGSGVNPLVDTAGRLFSILGKLNHLQSYSHLNELHKELIAEITRFQKAAEAKGYRPESVLASRYALCATLDDRIANTSWGSEGQWNNDSLLAAFNAGAVQQERFFLILERMTKEPALYIDVMELMYMCLSLGYKGSYRATERSRYQLEKITDSLYKRIRAYHGDFNRTLSSFPVKEISQPAKITPPKTSYGLLFLVVMVMIIVIFVGLGALLDTISHQTYQALTDIGKSIVYETHQP